MTSASSMHEAGHSKLLTGWGGCWEEGSGWGTHVHLWLIHIGVWQKSPQYCNYLPIKINNLKNQKTNSKVYKQQTNVEAPSPSSSVLPRPTVCSWEEWLGFLRLYTFLYGCAYMVMCVTSTFCVMLRLYSRL